MEKIKRFIECLIPVTACNLKCSYCYVIQRDNRKNKLPNMKYDICTIKKALTKERFGGSCYFSICGAGETLIPTETLEITKVLLENGHYVNITTNGTLTNRIDEITRFPEYYKSKLQIAFSLHYLELKRLNLIDVFFENVMKVKNAGCSVLVQLNLTDCYLPYIEEIKKICMDRLGTYPQIAATREEDDINSEIKLMTKIGKDEYIKIGRSFNSKLFDFTIANFNVKRKEFCYAGDWSFTLNLGTGILRRCYNSIFSQNIFENIDKPIKFCAIGKSCNSVFCMNSSHFMSLGVIPEVNTPTYLELRNRSNVKWYTQEMQTFLSTKLYESNELYSYSKKLRSRLIGIVDKCGYLTWRKLNKIKKR